MSRHSHLAALRHRTSAQNAKALRRTLTDAERKLWYHVRAARFQGWRFRRQVPIGHYVVDFLCEDARLVVELDGGQHADQAQQDRSRTAWLNEQGYDVIRFWNDEVMREIGGVLEKLFSALSERT